MKLRSLLAVLLLPCAALAQQAQDQPGQDTKPAITVNPSATTDSPLEVSGVVLDQPGQDTNQALTLGTDNPLTDYSVGQNQSAFTFGSPLPDTRITLDLENASLRDALRSIFDNAKLKYEVDKDVPDDARITVHAKNVRFGTALDLITQAAGVGWSHETTLTGNAEKAHTLYRITKESHAGTSYRVVTNPQNRLGSTVGSLLLNQSKAGQDVFFANPAKGQGRVGYEFFSSERRSTFTCPHCKGQVTVVRHVQAPKCPKCGRTFQSDWQFCPVDGAKRPQDPGEWKFCPLCGKPIDLGTTRADVEVPILSDLPVVGTLFESNKPTKP